MTAVLPDPAVDLTALAALSDEDLDALLCSADLGVWNERRRGYTNAPVHWEWATLAQTRHRLAIVAPRDHAKSELLTVGQVAWRSIYQPGTYSFVFALTNELAADLKQRIDAAVEQDRPQLVAGAYVRNVRQSVYANGSTVRCAGVGKAVRGGHPDCIVLDDVLDERNTMTAYQRRKIERWFTTTVAGMAHPGIVRTLPRTREKVTLPPTRIHMVGTPFHQSDLLMNLRHNSIYSWLRYAAEFNPAQLVPGSLAVQANRVAGGVE